MCRQKALISSYAIVIYCFDRILKFNFYLTDFSFTVGVILIRKYFQEKQEADLDRDLFLINRIRHGDEAAMEEFVLKYYRQIADYCRYHTYGKDEAESAAQDTFVKFFSSVAAYRHRGKALNYLYRIAGNTCTDIKRKEMREDAVKDALMRKAALAGQDICGHEHSIEAAEIKIDVESGLAALSPEIRETVMLFYFQDMKIKDIAEATDAGVSLVKYRLKRGRELLKKSISGMQSIQRKEDK